MSKDGSCPDCGTPNAPSGAGDDNRHDLADCEYASKLVRERDTAHKALQEIVAGSVVRKAGDGHNSIIVLTEETMQQIALEALEIDNE